MQAHPFPPRPCFLALLVLCLSISGPSGCGEGGDSTAPAATNDRGALTSDGMGGDVGALDSATDVVPDAAVDTTAPPGMPVAQCGMDPYALLPAADVGELLELELVPLLSLPADTINTMAKSAGYDNATCSPARVNWEVAPDSLALSKSELASWCGNNPWSGEDHPHGSRTLVTALEWLSQM